MSEEGSALKTALIEAGLWARKSLGQHFLLDPSITARIAARAGAIAGRPVLEIGPGPGALTEALLDAGADPLIVIEMDPRFVDFLERLQPKAAGRLHILHADALDVDEAELLRARGVSEPAFVVSNLPYNVGTPLLVKWLHARDWRGPMTLMFQKEVAERIVAKPGADAYGRLAVLAQAATEAKIVLQLPPRAFTPPPKVASAVVHLVDLPAPFAHLEALERVTAAAFGQRRKMLRSSLRSVFGDTLETALAEVGVDPELRAEQVPVAQFCALAQRLAG
jgi:16S rRNA (adenine1518-N6/adenine1519-N6)-dimethyltransferase